MRARRPSRRSILVWVPVGTNVALVVIAAIMGERVAVALTAVGAVVVTGAVVTYIRESEFAEERIAYLQSAIPSLMSMDSETVRNLAPKPSAAVTEALKHAETPVSVSVPELPIDRS